MRARELVRVALVFAAGCGGGGGPGGNPPGGDAGGDAGRDVVMPPGGVRAGLRCLNDDDCDSATLVCDARTRLGVCTAGCRNARALSDEEAQCGGAGSTCLTEGAGEGARGACTRACRPNARSVDQGACVPGMICTGWWFLRGSSGPDSPGCVPFCADDAHCGEGLRCEPREGVCGGTENAGGLPDGMPCDPRRAPAEGRSRECRGACVAVTNAPMAGICGSFVDLARTQRCPDDPDRIVPLAPRGQDNLAVCVFRRCVTDADCTAPLRCLRSSLTRTMVCTHPEP